MKVLVTGSNGQLGFCLLKKLQQKNIHFLATSRRELDISDLINVNRVINEYVPDVIINAAAYTSVDKAETDIELAYSVNVDGAKNLAEVGSAIGAVIFHISTDYVFNGDSKIAYNEYSAPAPINVYGKTKLLGEQVVSKGNKKHIILRTSWVFGEHGDNFPKAILRVSRTQDKLMVVSDQIGGPTYVGDLADVILNLLLLHRANALHQWGTYHYCGYPYVSRYEFALEILQSAASQGVSDIPAVFPVSSFDYVTVAQRPQNSSLDCGKIYSTWRVNPSNWRSALNDIKGYLEYSE
ncbi:MAG: dTDP-4-dehydrorhamnose reductase [Gammaproteobacteria bacterium]|nr:MAG: dTDP-4-dehydrorhamnose reductase [Gammaproteobacteria bacterium]